MHFFRRTLLQQSLIEDYCDKTSREWRWFIADEQELERRKELLLRSIGEALLPAISAAPGPPTVHILAPTPRSGSNLLAFLVVESGCCRWPAKERVVAEDFFLKHAHLLEDSLLESIGRGLARFAAPDDSQLPVVLKTPESENIDLLPRLFPGSKALFIVRDGRDTVESAATAFPQAGYEFWMERWARGVRRIREFSEQAAENPPAQSFKLVRYEELIRGGSPVVREIVEFLDGTNDFTWRDLQSLPIYGSSYLGREGGEFAWAIRHKPDGFNPVGRWARWGADRKEEFKRIAGPELIKLQYVEDDRW